MAFLDRFRGKKTDDEATWRARLLRNGRIAEGRIIDVTNDAQGALAQIFYSYYISGVEYESSQSLTEEQRRRAADYAPGARVNVRYDPQRPGNSLVE